MTPEELAVANLAAALQAVAYLVPFWIFVGAGIYTPVLFLRYLSGR